MKKEVGIMKNQYIGDIGDFGKYGLILFIKMAGINIGVNWYLTPNDGTNNGKFTQYLNDHRMRTYDPELFSALEEIAFRSDKNICMIENSTVFNGIQFYSDTMNFSEMDWREREKARIRWHQEAMKALEKPEIIFADPDNGLSVNVLPGHKNAHKYIMPVEIMDYYKRGQQMVYYHHRPRKNAVEWMVEKQRMRTFLPDAKLLALSFHRWSARTYIFVLHEGQYERYYRLLQDFLDSPWGTYRVDGKIAFTTEEI